MPKTYLFSSFPDYSSPGFSLENFKNLFCEGNVIISARSSDILYEEHEGSFTLKCAFKGEEYYATRKCRYKVDDDSFLVINEGHSYSSYIKSVNDVESFSIFFNGRLVNDMLYSIYNSEEYLTDNPEPVRKCRFPANAELQRYDGKMLNELLSIRAMVSAGFFEDGMLREKLQNVLEALFLKNEETKRAILKIPAVNNSTKEEYYRRLKPVIDCMHSNYETDISIETLSKVACINPSHLIRIFKKVHNITPYSYLTNVRLEKSKKLLENTDLTITRISSLVGFEKLSSFSYLFSNKYRISPSGYRIMSGKKVNFEETLPDYNI